MEGWLFSGRAPRPGRMLGGFVDSLLQGFENRRAGLSNDTARAGEKDVEPFFRALYEKEVAHLHDSIRHHELNLSAAAKEDFFAKVDELLRKVVLPAYARLSGVFTLRERNDFYLLPEPLHGLERLLWTAGGIALGAFAVWAPFIPIWEKEVILPFAVAGLFFPNLRRVLAVRRYSAELNRLVARTDDEIWRMELAYLTGDVELGEAAPSEAELAAASSRDGVRDSVDERASSANEPAREGSPRPKLRQGGR